MEPAEQPREIKPSYGGDQRGAIWDINTVEPNNPANQQGYEEDVNQRGIDFVSVPSVPGGGGGGGGDGLVLDVVLDDNTAGQASFPGATII